MGRITAFVYGVVVYAVMFLTFLYLFAFLADVGVPKTVNSGIESPLWAALSINTGLILLFGLQHVLYRHTEWPSRFGHRGQA